MKPIEFLDSALRLSYGANESDWRSAISRAYYAVFHYFREFFLMHGLNLGRSGQSHFNLSGPFLLLLSRLLDRLRFLQSGPELFFPEPFPFTKLLTRAFQDGTQVRRMRHEEALDFFFVLMGP